MSKTIAQNAKNRGDFHRYYAELGGEASVSDVDYFSSPFVRVTEELDENFQLLLWETFHHARLALFWYEVEIAENEGNGHNTNP